MARSTGPVLATGLIMIGNRTILHGQPVEDSLLIVAATGILAGTLALTEQASPQLAVGLAWLGLLTVVLTRVDPAVPSPAESLAAVINHPPTTRK